MEPPIFDENESLNQYLRKVKKYEAWLLKDKYNRILDFLNLILNLDSKYKLKSILEFKNIYSYDLFKRKKKYQIFLTIMA